VPKWLRAQGGPGENERLLGNHRFWATGCSMLRQPEAWPSRPTKADCEAAFGTLTECGTDRRTDGRGVETRGVGAVSATPAVLLGPVAVPWQELVTRGPSVCAARSADGTATVTLVSLVGGGVSEVMSNVVLVRDSAADLWRAAATHKFAGAAAEEPIFVLATRDLLTRLLPDVRDGVLRFFFSLCKFAGVAAEEPILALATRDLLTRLLPDA
jgi:hypothetical protein